ncbi:hypothetical protein GBK23_10080 [Bifidobacterium longum]|jgi:hypothetical protein|uniref:hypothetical protein n=1 Tax=Bifidobacterium longum TaxID=216816 RepID=UPI001323147D|nr:hypothetical protein GBK23_10080 [Bifidobacterium longum]KAB6732067.1 hypothetical protein GBK78_06135 [Bifidobacterium longum]KAB6751269.1 hypothetical protein GBK33_06480 [Bifidobacterium longum]KAB6754314.1 hypothetical protein GBK18_07185 [Bifidobacterium longum]KAB6765750.1 hypothetical protein GBK27_06375 [Bifidobacterium longum]
MHVEEFCSVFARKKAREMLHFVNVLDYADAGKVDPHSPEDGSFDNLDLRHIRRFVQLDIRLRTQVKKTVGYAAGWDAIPRPHHAPRILRAGFGKEGLHNRSVPLPSIRRIGRR